MDNETSKEYPTMELGIIILEYLNDIAKLQREILEEIKKKK